MAEAIREREWWEGRLRQGMRRRRSSPEMDQLSPGDHRREGAMALAPWFISLTSSAGGTPQSLALPPAFQRGQEQEEYHCVASYF